MVDGIKDLPLLTPAPQQGRALQLRQMSRQGGKIDLQTPSDLTNRKAGRPLLHQQLKGRQPGFLSKREQRADRFFRFHICIIAQLCVITNIYRTF